MITKLGFKVITRKIDKDRFIVNIGFHWYYSDHWSVLYHRYKFGTKEFNEICFQEYSMRPTENTIEMWEDAILFHYINNK